MVCFPRISVSSFYRIILMKEIWNLYWFQYLKSNKFSLMINSSPQSVICFITWCGYNHGLSWEISEVVNKRNHVLLSYYWTMEHYQQRSHFLLSNHLHTHLFTMLYCSFTPPTMLDTIFGHVADRNYTANILIRFVIVIHYVRTLEHYEQKGTKCHGE